MFMPININVSNKKVVIVGGGNIAFRRVKTLLDYNAIITIISPDINEDLYNIKDEFEWISSFYKIDVIREATFVIASTSDDLLNSQVYNDCSKLKILCLNVSDGRNSDFHIPAIIKKGIVQVSISTQGESPGISKLLKADLEKLFDEEWMEKASNIVEIRKIIKKNVVSKRERERILVELVDLSLEELKQRRQQYEDQNRF